MDKKSIIASVLKKGGSLQDAADAVGVTKGSIQYAIRKDPELGAIYNDPMRPRPQGYRGTSVSIATQDAIRMVMDENTTPKDAARACGIQVETLYKHLWRNGWRGRPDMRLAAKMVIGGASVKDASQEVGCNPDSIYGHLLRSGVSIKDIKRDLRRGRKALVIGQTEDAWGGLWDVREERETAHGWPLCFGWPAGMPRGRGAGGGPRAIITAPLMAYLDGFRADPASISLPCARSTIKRLRRELGHSWYDEREAWWLDRLDDLSSMTGAAFAAAHGVSEAAASLARSAMLGPRQRPAGWWREEHVQALLLADYPRQHIADVLGLSVGAVGRLRWMCKTMV